MSSMDDLLKEALQKRAATDPVRRGRITAESGPSDGDVTLRNSHDTFLIDSSELDDVIAVLCELRSAQDPAGYLNFIGKLIPATAPVGQQYTFRDIFGETTRISVVASADGRINIEPSLHEGELHVLDCPRYMGTGDCVCGNADGRRRLPR